MILYLLSSLFLSNKIYMAASLNKHYIPLSRAMFIIILATLLDDIAYYIFDNKYALSNFSSIFYFTEIIISCFALSLFGRLFGGSPKQLSFSAILISFRPKSLQSPERRPYFWFLCPLLFLLTFVFVNQKGIPASW